MSVITPPYQTKPYRLLLLLSVLAVGALALVWRMAAINLDQRQFLQDEGNSRYLRVMEIPASRGMITDRNGEPLAISTPIDSVWINPRLALSNDEQAIADRSQWPELARLLGISDKRLIQRITKNKSRGFLYLKRHVDPEVVTRIDALGLTGVEFQQEHHRYYPMGEVFSQVVGFTGIDDKGQEGIELLLERELRGTPGSKRVIKDRLGRVVENVESIHAPRLGGEVQLSLDKRIQYLAYRELLATVKRHQAQGGSAVVLDTTTGEVLAMVNQPSYNPNDRSNRSSAALRNRAVTDSFEPGSTMKPFTIAAALESGRYTPETPIDTNPGSMRLGGFTIRDHRNYGAIDVATVIQKSSNVGAGKIALDLESGALWGMLANLGFGSESGSHFPGEIGGRLNPFQQWHRVEQATIGYGYGLSVTTLQLARAYAVIAADGIARPVTFIKGGNSAMRGSETRVMSTATAQQVRAMMEQVTANGGTATRAQVPEYRVAGKTGTVRKMGAEGYAEENYLALFAGFAPASDPRLVMVSVIDQPDSGDYYGGVVAAPLFSKVMSEALRLLDIPPDDLDPEAHQQLAGLGGGR